MSKRLFIGLIASIIIMGTLCPVNSGNAVRLAQKRGKDSLMRMSEIPSARDWREGRITRWLNWGLKRACPIFSILWFQRTT
jgi:hypothetical protein